MNASYRRSPDGDYLLVYHRPPLGGAGYEVRAAAVRGLPASCADCTVDAGFLAACEPVPATAVPDEWLAHLRGPKPGHYGRTIQLWPGGGVITVDSHERPPESGPLTVRTTVGGWRPATPAEVWAVKVQETAERLLEREVWHVDSALVTAAMELPEGGCGDLGAEFSIDNVKNLYPDPSDWSLEQCKEWLEEHGIPDPRIVAADDIDAYREEVSLRAEAEEVFEWWRISEWLAEKLTELGEPVLDNAYGYWWGRTCTGQAVIMDGTLQKVARMLHASDKPADA